MKTSKILTPKNKAEYLKKNYPFVGVPKLDEKRYCLHCSEIITVGDYKVEFSDGIEYIVCPNHPKCSGTLIDWVDENHGKDSKNKK